MIGTLDWVARRFLRALDPETAHALALKALNLASYGVAGEDHPCLALEAFGLSFRNPLGIAAGFDKNGEAVDAVLRLGVGFAEVGTVTRRGQPGNPRPRQFRLISDAGVINRLGFNNQGHAAVRARLSARRPNGIVGVNLGVNRDSDNRIADYVAGIAAFAPVASYFVVNVSSPNTPGLRDLQHASLLEELLARVLEARDGAPAAERRPVLLKIAPDLSLDQLDDIVAVARRHGIDGMIIANTTVTRPVGLKDVQVAREAGGLSGRPLFALSTRMLAETFVRVEGDFPLVGVGGIDSGVAAWGKIGAGASLIQLYTGLVYRGLGLVADIKRHLVAELANGKFGSVADAVGRDAHRLTAEPWPS